MTTIICKVCGSQHESIWKDDSNTTQGIGCASVVFRLKEGADDWVIQGCFGSSEFDTDRYRFLSDPPDVYKNADPVCDRCFGALISHGLVEQVPGDYW